MGLTMSTKGNISLDDLVCSIAVKSLRAVPYFDETAN